jgi:hypothetical protein
VIEHIAAGVTKVCEAIVEEELYLAADIDTRDLEIRTPFAVPTI